MELGIGNRNANANRSTLVTGGQRCLFSYVVVVVVVIPFVGLVWIVGVDRGCIYIHNGPWTIVNDRDSILSRHVTSPSPCRVVRSGQCLMLVWYSSLSLSIYLCVRD